MGGKILFAAILVLAFVAIALSPVNQAALYEDQLYELDLFSRCNDIGRDIKSGNVSSYTRRHLVVLKEELSALAPEDPSLQNVNRIYLECIALLSQAVDATARGKYRSGELRVFPGRAEVYPGRTAAKLL